MKTHPINKKNNFILFGFPVMRTKIDKKSYDKKTIVSTIEKNFELNKKRNVWDKRSVLHHAYKDFDNPKYHQVNFSTLMPVYKEILLSMFKKMPALSDFEFKFTIINYTCLSKSNYMVSHIHPGVDFTAVHYIQFDKKYHTPTTYENHLPCIDYINKLSPKLTKTLSDKDDFNSWAYKDWSLDIEEDDFCFSPAFLKHRIDPQTSKNKNRIAIVLNIWFI
tara:strand:+ start:3383 stop:4042 length:660 start_codon:yes stop_codon:yes gene_type:complete